MRKSIKAIGAGLALLGAVASSAGNAQDGCDDLREQYRGIEALAARPMTLSELRQLATRMSAIRTDVVLFEPPAGSPPSIALTNDQTYAIEALRRLATQLGIGCATSMTAIECADYLVNVGAHAVRLADPGGFQAWRIEEALTMARASQDERATRIFASQVGVACPAQGPCRDYLIGQLEVMQGEADAIQLLGTATDQAIGRDARAPLFNLVKNELLETMGELRCGEGSEASPATLAENYSNPNARQETEAERNAYFQARDRAEAASIAKQEEELRQEYESRDRDRELFEAAARSEQPTDPGGQTLQQPQPIAGGPVVEMDPARPPEPTPTGGFWTTVSSGQMIYRGTSELGTWSWNEPPQSIGPEGALIMLTVSGQVTNNNTWATGIQIRSPGFALTSPGGIPIDGDLPLNLERNGSGERQIVVKVTPQDNYVGSDAVILIGAFYGAQVRYYYKVVRSADR